MAKRKSLNSLPDVSGFNYILIKNGIKVYPVGYIGKFKIQVDNNGKLKTFDKLITQGEVNEAINKTIRYYYDKLKENESK
jgi:hypothetical protein